MIALGLPVVSFGQPQILPDPIDPPAEGPPPIQVTIGQMLFFDTRLSSPQGTSCASCHDPGAGWSDPRSVLDPLRQPTSESAAAGRFGPRNSPTTLYSDLGPTLFFDAATGSWIGGRYWDGHASSTLSQALVPFTGRTEMNNPSVHSVVISLRKSAAAPLIEQTFGRDIWKNEAAVMDAVANCLAAYEAAVTKKAFHSRFDRFKKGDAGALTSQEKAGMALFEGKGTCASCHSSLWRPDVGAALFTTHRYYNLGVPRNPNNPFYGMPASINPDGGAYIDKGLGGTLGLASEDGKFKVPTLRNVAVTSPYMHNGVFATLDEVVRFHSTRDVSGMWDPPEIPGNVARGPALVRPGAEGGPTLPPDDDPGGGLPPRLGNLGLTPLEIQQIVAFLDSLTDEPAR